MSFRILLLSTGGHIGGEESFTRDLALGLMARGHQVWVAPGGPVQQSNLEFHHIPVADINIGARSIAGLFSASHRISRFVRNNNISIVHCQAAGPAIMGGLIRLFRRGQNEKWIFHNHGLNANTYRWLPFFLKRLDLSVSASSFEMNRLLFNGLEPDNCLRIHNGVEPGNYHSDMEKKTFYRNRLRTEMAIDRDAFVFAYIGRLSPEKGCDLILPAFHENIQKGLNIQLLVIGDGIMRESMENQRKLLQLENKVFFTGFRSDIPEMLTVADCLLLPSYRETFSLTSLQAMATSIPVIASDAGGNSEQVIHSFNGFLFQRGNISDLSKRIQEMVVSESAESMGINGKNYVDAYLNQDRMIQEIELQYQRISL